MDLEIDDVAPVRDPFVEQRAFGCFHQLIAASKIRLHPAGYVRQAIGGHPSAISESTVNRDGVPIPEVLDH